MTLCNVGEVSHNCIPGYSYCFFFVSVRFRFVVFRPFVDEVLVGKIRSCSAEGVRGLSVCLSVCLSVKP